MNATTTLETPTLGKNATLALKTIDLKPTVGIPNTGVNLMHIPLMEEVAGYRPGDYQANPEKVYLAFQKNIGACRIDQFIPRNPLSMTAKGFASSRKRTATTGAENIVLDGITIDSPEAVAEHLESFFFPSLIAQIEACDPEDNVASAELIGKERAVQATLGENILKIPYGSGFNNFPKFRYGRYGYVNYFMAYALFPEIMERDFSLQATLAEKKNRIAARAYTDGNLPKLLRLDFDMASSQGPFVNVKTLDKIWFPHFARSIQPYLDAGIRLIWHCDGNLMPMLPGLLQAGLGGFQGFQYEDGMDYERICKMTTRDGDPLLIQAGVSVTTTLPNGTQADVKKELKWLVDNGPRAGLFLSVSSSVTPSTNPDNLRTLFEGLKHYREKGRS